VVLSLSSLWALSLSFQKFGLRISCSIACRRAVFASGSKMTSERFNFGFQKRDLILHFVPHGYVLYGGSESKIKRKTRAQIRKYIPKLRVKGARLFNVILPESTSLVKRPVERTTRPRESISAEIPVLAAGRWVRGFPRPVAWPWIGAGRAAVRPNQASFVMLTRN